ncbi:MAG: hypothetical protein ACTHNU_00785 [Gaiellales bacterium]
MLCVVAGVLGMLAMAPQSALAADPPDSSWQTNGTVRTITFANGVMYLGGDFTTVRPPGAAANSGFDVTRDHVAAFNESTGDLLSWNPDVNGRVYAIAVSGSTVYLGGLFTAVGGKPRSNLAAVSVTSGAPTSWNPGANRAVNAVAVGPNKNVFVGGEFDRLAGATRHHIGELTASGSLASWAPNIGQVTGFACPPRCPPTVFSIRFSTSGKNVYFGGHFGLVNGVSRNEIAEVPVASGSTVLPFNPNIYAAANCPTCQTVETSRVYRIITTSTRIYTCGGYWKVNGNQQSYNVSAFNPTTGKLDTSFRGEDDGDTPGCSLRGGVLYIGGHFNVAGFGCTPSALGNCTTRHHVAALDGTNGDVLSWNPSADSVHGLLAISGDSTAMGFGGYFTKMGGVSTQGIALYHNATLP